MNTTPDYRKWCNGAAISQSGSAADASTVTPGYVFDKQSKNRNQNPPTNNESFTITETVFIPTLMNEQGMPTPVAAKLFVNYRVEDWGTASVNGTKIIDLTTATEAAASYGGHAAWSGSHSSVIMSGVNDLVFTYKNIKMTDPNMNRIICEYAYRAVELERGGKKEPQPCSCACSCKDTSDGGPRGTTPVTASSADTPAAALPSSAGSGTTYSMTEDSMLWSCHAGTLRGLGCSFDGKLRICRDTFDSVLATPAALAFTHPMMAKLVIPEGGAVMGAK